MSQSHDPRARAHPHHTHLGNLRREQIEEDICAVVRKYSAVIKRACAHGAATCEDLKELEDAVVRLGVQSSDYIAISGSQDLRQLLGLILGSGELESKGAFLLKDLDRVLASHPQAFRTAFSSHALADVFGAVLAAPTYFHNFHQNRDALPLELIAGKLRKVLSTECFDRWQQCMTRSLLWGYGGVHESPSASVYAERAQLRTNSFVFESEQTRDRVATQIHQLLQVQEPIPGILWEVLNPAARREISLQLPMKLVLGWASRGFHSLGEQIETFHESLKTLRVGEQDGSYEGEDTHSLAEEGKALHRSEFERYCASVREICRFLVLYLDHKMHDLGDDPIRERLAPRCLPDQEAQQEDEVAYTHAKLTALVQERISRGLIAAMEGICRCMANQSIELTCPKDFAHGVVELLDELDLHLDIREEGRRTKSFYSAYMLPCFSRAIERGDLGSARSIQLLFPPDSRESPTVKRFVIDEYISTHQEDILRALTREAELLAGMFKQLTAGRIAHLPEVVEQRLEEFLCVLLHFPLERSIAGTDLELVRAVATVVYALLTWDYAVESYSNDRDDEMVSGLAERAVIRSFTGCRKAAELLAALGSSSSSLHRCIMGAALSKKDPRSTEALAHFIAHTNSQLVRALQSLASGEVALSDILPECSGAFRAERLYQAATMEHDRLPGVMVQYLPLLLEVGYHVVKNQEEFVLPEGFRIVHSSDLNCVRLWQAGIVGVGQKPYRHNLMCKFFDYVKQNRGQVPESARSLVFDSIADFAEDLAAKAQKDLDQEQFIVGISHVLSGLLISSAKPNIGAQVTMARALAKIFRNPRSRFLCEGDQQQAEIVDAFHVFTQMVASQGFSRARESFFDCPAIRALLQNVGLVARENPFVLPDILQD